VLARGAESDDASFPAASFCAVTCASGAGTFAPGSTPVPSRFVYVIGLIAREEHSNHEAIVDSFAAHRVCAPSRRLSNYGGALEILEVVLNSSAPENDSVNRY
jgi:hypothetical protein